jgi:hypothetical protein
VKSAPLSSSDEATTMYTPELMNAVRNLRSSSSDEATTMYTPELMNAVKSAPLSSSDEATTMYTPELMNAVNNLRTPSSDEATTMYTPEVMNAVKNSRLSMSDEATTLHTLDLMAKRNSQAARITIPDLELEDDTATVERPRTQAEKDRIAAIAAHLDNLPMPDSSSLREERSTLSLDIDTSEFDLS